MSVTIDLPRDIAETIQKNVARSGQNVSAFVLVAVREKITRGQILDEICAPFAQAVGVTDDMFDEFFEKVRGEVWHDDDVAMTQGA